MADNFTRLNAQGTIARPADQATFDAGLRKHMLSVYNYLASGLALSGIVALLVFSNVGVSQLFFQLNPQGRLVGMTGLGWVVTFAPLAMLFASGMVMRGSRGTAQAFYWVFVTLMGISLTTILYRYTGGSVVRVFFITAAAFAGLSLYGYTTKRSLSAMGSFLMMGLIGLVIAMIVNIFLQSPMMYFVISGIGVLIFSGLIAFDTQNLKEQYSANWDNGTADKVAIFGALGLYLNFINLFQFLLAFFGNRE
jgi:FtsH-binding integral membrane protein